MMDLPDSGGREKANEAVAAEARGLLEKTQSFIATAEDAAAAAEMEEEAVEQKAAAEVAAARAAAAESELLLVAAAAEEEQNDELIARSRTLCSRLASSCHERESPEVYSESDEEEQVGTSADDSAPTQSGLVNADERVPTQANEAVGMPDAAEVEAAHAAAISTDLIEGGNEAVGMPDEAEVEAAHAAAISTDLIEGGTGEDLRLLLAATHCEDAGVGPMDSEEADTSASRETLQAACNEPAMKELESLEESVSTPAEAAGEEIPTEENVAEDGAGDSLISPCDDEGECGKRGVEGEDEHEPAAHAADSAAAPAAAETEHTEVSDSNTTSSHPDQAQELPPALEDDSERAQDAKALEDLQEHHPAPSGSNVVESAAGEDKDGTAEQSNSEDLNGVLVDPSCDLAEEKVAAHDPVLLQAPGRTTEHADEQERSDASTSGQGTSVEGGAVMVDQSYRQDPSPPPFEAMDGLGGENEAEMHFEAEMQPQIGEGPAVEQGLAPTSDEQERSDASTGEQDAGTEGRSEGGSVLENQTFTQDPSPPPFEAVDSLEGEDAAEMHFEAEIQPQIGEGPAVEQQEAEAQLAPGPVSSPALPPPAGSEDAIGEIAACYPHPMHGEDADARMWSEAEKAAVAAEGDAGQHPLASEHVGEALDAGKVSAATGHDEAVVKIQALARGGRDSRHVKQVRERLLARSDDDACHVEGQSQEAVREAACVDEEEMKDKAALASGVKDAYPSQDDEAAVLKIQALSRGKRGRERVHELRLKNAGPPSREHRDALEVEAVPEDRRASRVASTNSVQCVQGEIQVNHKQDGDKGEAGPQGPASYVAAQKGAAIDLEASPETAAASVAHAAPVLNTALAVNTATHVPQAPVTAAKESHKESQNESKEESLKEATRAGSVTPQWATNKETCKATKHTPLSATPSPKLLDEVNASLKQLGAHSQQYSL